MLKADVVISLYIIEMGILPYINDGSKKILEFLFRDRSSKLIEDLD